MTKQNGKTTVEKQRELITEMATPVQVLWDRMLFLPIIGPIDSKRSQLIMDTVLEKILANRSKVIIIDILGVPTVDSAVANHIIKITKATKLVGCQCILTGISNPVAQTLVHLGIDLKDVKTMSTLEDGLGFAFEQLGYEIKR